MSAKKTPKKTQVILITIVGAVLVVLSGVCITTFSLLMSGPEPDPGIGIVFWVLLFGQYVVLIPLAVMIPFLIGARQAAHLDRSSGMGSCLLSSLAGLLVGAVLVTVAASSLYFLLGKNKPVVCPPLPDPAGSCHPLDMRGTIEDADLSPDGSRLAVASASRAVYVWEVETGKLAQTFDPINYRRDAYSVAWSPDGQLLAASMSNDQVVVWEPGTNKELQSLTGHSHPAWSLAWSPDGRALATVEFEQLLVWDVHTGRLAAKLAHPQGAVEFLAWSPGGDWLASQGDGLSITIWDVQSWQPAAELKNGYIYYNNAAWSSDGALIAAAGNDGTIDIWDTKTWKIVHNLSGQFSVDEVAWSPDGARLAATTSTIGGQVLVWDAQSGKKLHTFAGNPSFEKNRIFWSPDGKRLITFWGLFLITWEVGSQP